ncbi:MAG TPA: MBOAT family protein [Fimbriimonadaceae bacterium]|nr:MBOAT family protein [Fimbriimonadaceae bacterium]
MYLVPWLLLDLVLIGTAIALPQGTRNKIAWLPFTAGIALLAFQWAAPSGMKLLTASLLMLFMVKLCALYAHKGSVRKWWILPYLIPWPGIDTKPFENKATPDSEEAARFSSGWTRMLFGAAMFAAVVWSAPRLNDWLLGALTVVASLVTVHLGLSYLITAIYRLAGKSVSPIMDDPWKSRTLTELWSHRWNRPFVEMNRILLLPAANRMLGRRWSWVVAFVASGILHELAISYPAQSGFGLPLSYFCIQAALIAVERRLSIKSGWWVAACWLLPTPILFPKTFLVGVIAPLARSLHASSADFVSTLRPETFVLALGLLTLVPVIASLQVPTKLRWKQEFARLTGLNRRVVWVYGSYVLATIFAIAAYLVAFKHQIVLREQPAVAVVGFAALFWSGRVVVDAVAFRSADWPPGAALAIGRTLLHSLLLALAGAYVALFVWLLA